MEYDASETTNLRTFTAVKVTKRHRSKGSMTLYDLSIDFVSTANRVLERSC